MTESTFALISDPGDPRHGTITAYTYHGCRCDRCRQANTEVTRAARDRRQAGRVPKHVHGTENGYSNYRCRCKRCIKAHNETQRLKGTRQ